MNYEFDCKITGFLEAKNPRNAKKVLRDILQQHNIILVEPTFKTKKVQFR